MDTQSELDEAEYCAEHCLTHCSCGEYWNEDECKNVDDEWLCPECYLHVVKCAKCGVETNSLKAKKCAEGFLCAICE